MRVENGLSGAAAAVAADHRVDLVRPADADVVLHERFEEGAGATGVVEHQGLADLDLSHRQLPAVAGGAVGGGERRGDLGDPAVEERLHVGGPEAVADRLQPLRLVAGANPLDSSVKATRSRAAWRPRSTDGGHSWEQVALEQFGNDGLFGLSERGSCRCPASAGPRGVRWQSSQGGLKRCTPPTTPSTRRSPSRESCARLTVARHSRCSSTAVARS
jgi:hypothetical protein